MTVDCNDIWLEAVGALIRDGDCEKRVFDTDIPLAILLVAVDDDIFRVLVGCETTTMMILYASPFLRHSMTDEECRKTNHDGVIETRGKSRK